MHAIYVTRATSASRRSVGGLPDARGQVKPDAEVARMRAELDRMRAVISEITAENLELKKKI